MQSRRIERTLRVFDSPADAEAETRRQYRELTPNERVALTVELQRRYYQASDPARRLLREFIRGLNARDVRYLVVGGHAVSFHGYPRFTHDIDVVVLPDERNAHALVDALSDFGFTLPGLGAADFMKPTTVVLGRAPDQVDIMTFIKGVDLHDAWSRRVPGLLDGIEASFIARTDLIANKRAVGRPEDLADIARLDDP